MAVDEKEVKKDIEKGLDEYREDNEYRRDNSQPQQQAMPGRRMDPNIIKALVLVLLAVPSIIFLGWIIGILLVGIVGAFLFLKPGSRKKFGKTLAVIFLVGVPLLFFVGPAMLGDGALISEETFMSITEKSAIGMAKFIGFFKDWKPFSAWRGMWDRNVAYATGGYFTGQVEESSEDERLGIYIENIASADPVIMEGNKVTIWADIRGKTIDEEVDITMDCKADKGNENKISEPKDITIYTYEEDYLNCEFSELPKGAVKVTFTADYNFKTMGYVKAYFMDQERLRALRSQDRDPLMEYDIRDKNPTAVYSNGPIRLGMGTVEVHPISVGYDDEKVSRVGITLENKWEGKIKGVEDFEIQVPASMELRECDHEMEQVTPESCLDLCRGNEECEEECFDYNFYSLKEEEKKRFKDIDDFVTVKCFLYTNSKNDLLGNAPISTKYIRTVVDYNYSSEAYKTFYVKENIDE